MERKSNLSEEFQDLLWHCFGFIPIKPFIAMGIAIGIPILGIAAIQVQLDKGIKRLEHKVMTIADTNGDNKVSETEWSEVYRSLGIIQDSRNPRRLTDSEMKRYIDFNSRDIDFNSQEYIDFNSQDY